MLTKASEMLSAELGLEALPIPHHMRAPHMFVCQSPFAPADFGLVSLELNKETPSVQKKRVIRNPTFPPEHD